MKRTNIIKFLSIALLFFVFSCSDNGPDCVNGVNVDGVCNCIEGWEGALCDQEAGPDCVNGVNIDGECQCLEGWEGELCDIVSGPPCVNGVAVGDDCECLEGWEGELCDIEERAKFIGTWEGTLSGCTIEIPLIGEFDIPELPISMMFEEGTDITELDVVFGMNDGTASINGDQVTLDPTTMDFDAGGFQVTVTISGVGTLVTDTKIEMDLNLEVVGSTTVCPLELNKV